MYDPSSGILLWHFESIACFFLSNIIQIFYSDKRRKGRHNYNKTFEKSVQSALSDLLTTSATHGTFSRPSTKRGLILIGLELNTNARESFEHC